MASSTKHEIHNILRCR